MIGAGAAYAVAGFIPRCRATSAPSLVLANTSAVGSPPYGDTTGPAQESPALELGDRQISYLRLPAQ